MVGWMDDEALHRTLTTGRVTFWSRSRQEYWRKGDTSGHVQHVRSVALDCDGDAVLVRVHQVGAACHTGTRTCFDGRDLAAIQGAVPAAGAAAGQRVTAGPGRELGGVWPALDTFRELARDRRVIPVVRRLLADAETPLTLYRKLSHDRPGHLPARVGRARRGLVALLDRRGRLAGHAHGGRRPGALGR